MPQVPFDSLPDSSRAWIFASDRPLTGPHAERLLGAVDEFLDQWAAHGAPLRCAREWRDDRFLAIGVDSRQAEASGCSIDGLFRAFQTLQREIGAQLLGGGRVFYRGADGGTRVVSRDEFEKLVESGAVSRDTPVFDTSVTTAGAYRSAFERPAAEAWTAAYF